MGGGSRDNLEHVCLSEVSGLTRLHNVDQYVPSLGRLLSNEQLLCSLSLRRVCLGVCASGVCVCFGGVCRGHSEELSTIKQSGHNVKPYDLLSNPCLTELCSTAESGAQQQLVCRWAANGFRLIVETPLKEKQKRKHLTSYSHTAQSSVTYG